MLVARWPLSLLTSSLLPAAISELSGCDSALAGAWDGVTASTVVTV